MCVCVCVCVCVLWEEGVDYKNFPSIMQLTIYGILLKEYLCFKLSSINSVCGVEMINKNFFFIVFANINE